MCLWCVSCLLTGLISSGPPLWSERFVVFRVIPMVLYFHKDTDTEPQRVIALSDVSRIEYKGEDSDCMLLVGSVYCRQYRGYTTCACAAPVCWQRSTWVVATSLKSNNTPTWTRNGFTTCKRPATRRRWSGWTACTQTGSAPSTSKSRACET